jgi:hemerythrin
MGIPWTDSLAVGIPEIDQQHQELFLRLERLLRGIVGGEREEVGRLLEFLGDYVVRHFGAEERWMAVGYDYALTGRARPLHAGVLRMRWSSSRRGRPCSWGCG